MSIDLLRFEGCCQGKSSQYVQTVPNRRASRRPESYEHNFGSYGLDSFYLAMDHCRCNVFF